ncbi:glycosyltransferase [Pseudomonas putida]
MNSSALVSIVIPAYKPQFFEKALTSAMLQDYENIEIIVSDDCRDGSIAAIVERNRPASRFPIRYFYNSIPLLEQGNLARAIQEARGEYVKPLYDDDLLLPSAVRKLLAVLQQHPGTTLASARRVRIDENDQPLDDNLLTLFPFKQDVLIQGQELVSFLGQHIFNFIGEPTSVMCRRETILAFVDGLMALDGVTMEWLGDLSIYLKLLRQGDLVMIAEPLACFRISSLQFSQIARNTPDVAAIPYARYRATVRALGWLRAPECNDTVSVATLADPQHFHSLNLGSYFRSGGVLPMGNAEMQAYSVPAATTTPVRDWLAQRIVTPAQQRLIEQQRLSLKVRASLCLVILDRHAAGKALELTLASIDRCFSGTSLNVEQHVVPDADGQWVETVNALVSCSSAQWLVMLHAGEQLLPGGALMLELELASAGDARAIYFDELYEGELDLCTAMRPGFNFDYLLSLPAVMTGHWLVRRNLFVELQGFDPGLPAAAELDLLLRLVEMGGLDGFTHLAEPLLITQAPVEVDNFDEVVALQRHLQRRGYRDGRVICEEGRRYRLHYQHIERPLVSIVLRAEHRLPVLQRCLESLLANTDYPAFEILVVDHRLVDVGVRDWLLSVEAIAAGKLRVLPVSAEASAVAGVNQVACQAAGEYVVLLDGDAVAIRGDWLDELLNQGQRPEVAIVAGKLVTPDGHVRQSGLVAGVHGVVGAAFDGVRIDQRGYLQRLACVQGFSAVPSSCMLVRSALFRSVAGFDETLQVGPLSDTDLCLRIAQDGHLVVWTPHAMLVQEARPIAPVVQADADVVHARWFDTLADDPAYNANCSLSSGVFSLETEVGLNWQPLRWRPVPRVLGCYQALGEARESRIVAPFDVLSAAGLADGALTTRTLSLSELQRFGPDVVVFQDNLTALPLQAMRAAKALPGVFSVLEVHAFLSTFACDQQPDPAQRWEALTQAAGLVDRVIVPTATLAEAFASLHPDVRVVETRLTPAWLDLMTMPSCSSRPRIGCAIEPSSTLDPQLMETVIRTLADRVDWVLWGVVPPMLRDAACEVLAESPQNDPRLLVELRLDLALAPLGTSGLDGCRSALTLLQFGACGYCVLASDTPAYHVGLQVTHVGNAPEHWLEAIDRHLSALERARMQGLALQQQVREHWVIDISYALEWMGAWTGR